MVCIAILLLSQKMFVHFRLNLLLEKINFKNVLTLHYLGELVWVEHHRCPDNVCLPTYLSVLHLEQSIVTNASHRYSRTKFVLISKYDGSILFL